MPNSTPTWTPAEQAVLAARRARLVRSQADAASSARRDVIVVSTAGVEVGLPESIVLAVRRLLRLTVVHGGPPALLGVFAEGEAVLPAFRLSSLLGVEPRPSERPCLLVLGRSGAAEVGIEVDRVVGPDLWRDESPAASRWSIATGGQTASGIPVLDPEALLQSPYLALS